MENLLWDLPASYVSLEGGQVQDEIVGFFVGQFSDKDWSFTVSRVSQIIDMFTKSPSTGISGS